MIAQGASLAMAGIALARRKAVDLTSSVAQSLAGPMDALAGYVDYRLGPQADTSGPAPALALHATGPRKYVYFSGLGSGPSPNPSNVVDTLVSTGIPRQDIIVHATPYRKLVGSDIVQSASLFKRNLVSNLVSYQSLTDPDSQLSRLDCSLLQKELRQAGAGPDTPVTLIGHSGGGQEASTLAAMLAQQSRYKVDTVVTLGTPFERNNTPSNVRMVEVQSPEDNLVMPLHHHLGLQVGPDDLGHFPNSLGVTVHATSHWGYLEPQVLSEIVKMANDRHRTGHVDLGSVPTPAHPSS